MRKKNSYLPCILQWNVNGLRAHLPDLRIRVTNSSPDVIALQEDNSLPGECRISNYTDNHSKTFRANGRSRASLYVRASLQQLVVDLNDLCSDVAEYVGVTVRLGACETTVVSVYVRPGVNWDPDAIRKIRQRCTGRLVICGDFNAHHSSWGCAKDDARGEALADVLSQLDLIILNDGFARARPPVL